MVADIFDWAFQSWLPGGLSGSEGGPFVCSDGVCGDMGRDFLGSDVRFDKEELAVVMLSTGVEEGTLVRGAWGG